MKSRAVLLLGPEDSICGAMSCLPPATLEAFTICAAVDTSQGDDMIMDRQTPVYNSLTIALAKSNAHTLIYDEYYIDVNGCGLISHLAKANMDQSMPIVSLKFPNKILMYKT